MVLTFIMFVKEELMLILSKKGKSFPKPTVLV